MKEYWVEFYNRVWDKLVMPTFIESNWLNKKESTLVKLVLKSKTRRKHAPDTFFVPFLNKLKKEKLLGDNGNCFRFGYGTADRNELFLFFYFDFILNDKTITEFFNQLYTNFTKIEINHDFDIKKLKRD
jgi:hypothetical protein